MESNTINTRHRTFPCCGMGVVGSASTVTKSTACFIQDTTLSHTLLIEAGEASPSLTLPWEPPSVACKSECNHTRIKISFTSWILWCHVTFQLLHTAWLECRLGARTAFTMRRGEQSEFGLSVRGHCLWCVRYLILHCRLHNGRLVKFRT